MYANKVTQAQCIDKGQNYLFAAGECVELKTFAAENNDRIILLVHGSWKPETNILGRYAPFAESINMNTDVTTVAVALPGYSGSSSNIMPPLEHEAKVTPSATKEYLTYLGKLVKAIKEKYNAQEITYVGHSAGARMGATLTALEPGLIQNAVLVGGRYINKDEEAKHGAISFDNLKDKADKETNYVLVYGSADKISEPSVTTSYYEQMKKDGFNVTLVEAKGAPHLDLEMTDATQAAIAKLFE